LTQLGLRPDLPAGVWTLEAGVAVNAVGNGVVLPFTALYLHSVRHFSLPTVGLILGAFAAAGFAGTIAAGPLIDRYGPKAILTAALALSAAGYALIPLVDREWKGFLFLGIAGAGTGAFWPSQSTLLARLTGRDRRHVAYALQRVVFNLGVGVGATIGGFVAVSSNPHTYDALFVGDAATFVAYILVLRRIALPDAEEPKRASEPGRLQRVTGGYASVLRDRLFVSVIGLNVLYTIFGYGVFEVAVPVFAKDRAMMSERQIGIVFLVDTIVIVALQLPLARFLEGRARMTALAAMSGMWAIGWLIAGVGGNATTGTSAAAIVGLGVGLFAAGECVLAPAQSSLVAEMADAGSRGRYLSLLSSSNAVGFALAPVLVGVGLSRSQFGVFPAAAVLLAVTGAMALAVGRALPERLRLIPGGTPRPESPRS
jgi:MFS family permease